MSTSSPDKPLVHFFRECVQKQYENDEGNLVFNGFVFGNDKTIKDEISKYQDNMTTQSKYPILTLEVVDGYEIVGEQGNNTWEVYFVVGVLQPAGEQQAKRIEEAAEHLIHVLKRMNYQAHISTTECFHTKGTEMSELTNITEAKLCGKEITCLYQTTAFLDVDKSKFRDL